MKDIQPTDLLLLIDIQSDFFPGGSLPVPNGDKIIPTLNEMIKTAIAHKMPIIVTRDWHPTNHISFKDQGGPYPPHCVQNTKGAEFHPEINLPQNIIIISKADTPENDTYSGFDGTTDDGILLPELLKKMGIKRLWVGGLCLDICVDIGVMDAIKYGYQVMLIKKATHSLDPNLEQKVLDKLQTAGVVVL